MGDLHRVLAGVVVPMKGECEHCGLRDKSQWLSRCLYRGNYPSRRAFELSTFDPPCAIDDYHEGQRELARDERRFFVKALLGAICIVGLIAAVVWWGGR